MATGGDLGIFVQESTWSRLRGQKTSKSAFFKKISKNLRFFGFFLDFFREGVVLKSIKKDGEVRDLRSHVHAAGTRPWHPPWWLELHRPRQIRFSQYFASVLGCCQYLRSGRGVSGAAWRQAL